MITVDAIKAAFRQTKDGYVITFVLHPQDDFRALMYADIGQQYRLQLVELDDNGNPEESEVVPTQEEPPTTPQPPSLSNPAAGVSTRLAEQAGMHCKKPLFKAFLREKFSCGHPDDANRPAVDFVYEICGIKSRKELIPGTPAGLAWDKLFGQFLVWQMPNV